jgi:ABC-type phosphate transport system ATPase subunit
VLKQAKRRADQVIFLYPGERVGHGSAREVFQAKETRGQKHIVTGFLGRGFFF